MEAGVDVVSDGEMSKISYATYIRHRLTGFEIGDAPRATPKDLDDFPDFKRRLAEQGGTPKYHRPICRGPIAVKDLSSLEKDIDNLKAAATAAGAPEAFMNSASPGVIAVFQPNEYYATDEEYLQALAEAKRRLDDLVTAEIPADLKAQQIVSHGTVYKEIIDAAKSIKVDLIVLASHRPELRDYLLGPNAARVVRHFPGSVLVVRE